MKHIDLFSGIGGFSYAADIIFYEEKIEHIFVEWEAFPQAVLRKHWPEAEIHGDIREFVANAHEQRRIHRQLEKQPAKRHKQTQRESVAGTQSPFLLTGGFPCQPFSNAGRRKGTADDRYLWPAMFEAITLFKPRWVIAENVAGLASWNEGLVLQTVCADLESEGYEVQPFVIPAAAVGAPHRRDRVWIVAHRNDTGGRASTGRANGNRAQKNKDRGLAQPGTGGQSSNAPNTSNSRLERGESKIGEGHSRQRSGDRSAEGPGWTENWPEVAARLCRMDDGLPLGVVRPRGWRNAALKAYGNAIVPQVAMQIMQAIKDIEKQI